MARAASPARPSPPARTPGAVGRSASAGGTAAARRALAALLATLPPFQGIPRPRLAALALELRPQRLAPGSAIFRQHEPAREFCLLVEGRLALSAEGADPDAPPIGVLEAPSWFGEMGILTGRPRSATVTAATPCLVWTLPRRRFERLCAEHPRILRNLLGALAERVEQKDRDFLGQAGLAAERGRLLQENARLYAEIRDNAARLEAASRHKSQFLARMSHELRTPLNAIIGFSEILAHGEFPVTPEEQREFLENILTAGRHLLRLINDVLDLSKVEAGKMELALTPVRLADVAAEVLATLRPLAAHGEIRLEADLPEALPLVRADPRRLAQILYNLLSNAIKFTPPRGAVSLEARLLPSGEAPAAAGPAWVEVAVRDTGTGIQPEDQRRIFEEFEQTRATRATPGGTGIGLALVKRLVALHGGSLGLTSEPGRGSRWR
ncbi:MAG: ATP-binding protein [Candidatus Methylomirabilales bacterium]